jgi:hypothetical protein
MLRLLAPRRKFCGWEPLFLSGPTALALRLCCPAVTKIQVPLLLGAAVLATAAFPFSLHGAQAADAVAVPLLDVSVLKPGTKGYGLTVFSGTQPERFEVEILGTLKNWLPNQDLILIKTTHPRLEVAKVVGGMSGSPVFVDGKVIGAYAYGWQFGAESVAGVTPIKGMLEDLQRPIPPEYLLPLRAPGVKLATLDSRDPNGSAIAYGGQPGDYDLRAHAHQIASHLAALRVDAPFSGPVPVVTPLMVGGVGEAGMRLLREVFSPLGLEPLQGGGASAMPDPAAPTRFVDGGAIGVQLIRGDISASGIGTVTRVSGDRLVAFGHPMLQGGVSRLPTAIATVHWVFASMARSFKMGAPVRPLGSLINDRQAAIVVDTKVEPPLFPVRLEVTGAPGAPHPSWRMEVAHERFMAPMFVSVALGNAMEATTSEKRDATWHAITQLSVRGHSPLQLHDFGVSVGGTPDAGAFMGSRAVRSLGALLNNPWQPVTIDAVDTKLDIRYARDLWTLRGTDPLETEIDAGQKAHLRLHLVPYAGPEELRVVEVDIPRELAGETVEIEIVPGHQASPELARPENLADLMANLPQQSYAPDVFVASVHVGGQGLAHRGQVASRLPPGALDTLRSTNSTMAPEPFASVVRTLVPMHHLVVGRDAVKVRVRENLR